MDLVPMKHDPRHARLWFLWLAVLIVLLAFALRSVAILGLPLFVDEVSHIYRAFRTVDGQTFIGLEHQKWLYTAVLALFRPYGPESVWLARTLSALSATLTTAAALAVGRLVGRQAGDAFAARWGGLAAGLFYAVLPMTVFHERQALVDPMMAMFVALATLFMMRLAGRPRLWLALLLAFTLAGAVLTKTAALPYLALPVVACVLLARRWGTFWRALALAVPAGAAGWVLYRIVVKLAERSGAVLRATHTPTLDNSLLFSLTDPASREVLRSNLGNVAEALSGYVGYGVLALAALALVWLVQRRAWRAVLFLLVPALAFIAPDVLFKQVTGTGYLPPRYLLPKTLPLTVLAGFSLAVLVGQVRRTSRAASVTIGLAVTAAVLIPALRFDAITITRPTDTPFTDVDRSQYTTLYDGYGTQQAAQALLAAWRAGGEHPLGVLGTNTMINALQVYLGPRVGTFENIDYVEDRAALIARWLAAGNQVYMQAWGDAAPEQLHDLDFTVTEPVGYYGSLYVVHVVGAKPELAGNIYTNLGGDPAFLASEYDALAAALGEDPTPRTVVVFPPVYAPELAERTALNVVPLAPGIWPPTPTAARAALADLDLGNLGTPVDVIMVSEERTDPARVVALAVQHMLYNTGSETWIGPFHRRRFVTGPADPPLASGSVTFEDAIDLTASITGETARPGGAVCIVANWQTDVPVRDSFTVFAHLIDANGALVAQHDAIPGDGLLPTTGWQPGEVVSDRFAIPLPPDLPPGPYEVYVGLYHPGSGLQLKITAGQQAPSDHVVIGAVMVGDERH